MPRRASSMATCGTVGDTSNENYLVWFTDHGILVYMRKGTCEHLTLTVAMHWIAYLSLVAVLSASITGMYVLLKDERLGLLTINMNSSPAPLV